VFLVSDFLGEGWERPMQITRQRHELVPVVVSDPMERALPPVGLILLEDLETGEVVEVDTRSSAREEFARKARAASERRDQTLRRVNVDVVEVSTDESYVDALVAFFRARAKRMAHG
jgi:uncharacterized protein (DUF58 family)